jgi:hypothetical protein
MPVAPARPFPLILGDAAAAAAAATNLELETELMPEQAFFTRSDQYPFTSRKPRCRS